MFKKKNKIVVPQTPIPPPYYGPNKPAKRPIFFRILLWVGLGLLGLIALLIIVASLFNKQITLKALNAAAEGLKTEVKISDVELSLIKGFPDAAVNFNDVRMEGVFGGNLLEAKELSLRFGLFSLFTDKVVVKKIVVKDGALVVKTDRRGKTNYNIFKESQSSGASNSSLAIALDYAVFENVEILYEDRQQHQEARLLVDKAEFAGDFSDIEYDMESRANLKVAFFDFQGERYLAGERVKYDAIFNIDNTKNLYTFQKMLLNLGANDFDISGAVKDKGKYKDMSLRMQSSRGDVSALFKLLPTAYASYFKDFKSTGTYKCNGTVKGRYSKNENPKIGFVFSLDDGQILSEKLQAPLRRVSFDADLKMDERGDGRLDVRKFYATFDGQPVRFDLKLKGFDDPLVDFHFKGAIPVSAAYGLVEHPLVTGGSGLLKIPSLTLKGRYSDMNSMYMVNKVDLSGTVTFDDAELLYNRERVRIKSGSLSLKDNVFALKKVLLEMAESDFLMEGSAKNLLPVLFADSMNTKDAYLDFNTNLLCENMDIDGLMALFTEKKSVNEAGGVQELDSLRTVKSVGRARFTEKLKGTFKSTIKNFNFNKIEGQDFRGDLTFDHKRLNIDGYAKTMKGKVHFEGETFFDIAPFMKMRINMKSLDMEECFRQCDDFDQEVITHKNIRGTVSGRLAAYLYWTPTGEFLMHKMKVYTDLLAHDGELKNVEAMKEFSKFVHVEDLEDIRFSTLQNYFEIKNNKLTIPAMFFQSNAVNMTLSGVHTMDNDINYFIKVNAGQALLKRLKRHDGNLDPMKASNGLFNLYYVVRGNLDDYDFFRGKRSVEKDFVRSDAKKREIIYILDKEFGTAPIPTEDGKEDTRPSTTGVNHAPPVYVEEPIDDGEDLEFLDEIEGGGVDQ